MEGGGGPSLMALADIGDFRKVEELTTVTEASVFSTLLVLLAARIGNVGGTALNEVFNQFGLESVIGLVAQSTILLQAARYFYWVVYGSYGKPWSPFIFVCMAVGLQLVYDAALKYGLFGFLPKGKNDLVDAVRRYFFEADNMVFAGHSIFIAATALIAMTLHEVADLPRYVFLAVVVFGIVLALSGVAAKPLPPPPPPKKKDEQMKDMRNYY